MEPPVSKSQLLDTIRAERSALDASIAGLSDARLSEPGVAGHWSVKDILVHVTWWEQRTIAKLHGETTEHDQLGGEDNDEVIDRLNDGAYRERAGVPAADVKASFRASLEAMMDSWAELSEEYLLANLELIAGNTYLHYPEHAVQIRAWLAKGVV